MKPIQSVSVFGLGKLGACIAATLAMRGFQVLGVDIDPEKVRLVNEGLTPVDEPLLGEAIKQGHPGLRATLDVKEALETEASFFIPPSPSLPDGSFSNEFLLKAIQPIAKAVGRAGKKGHLFVSNSTTTPGACDRVLIPMIEKETGWQCGREFHFCDLVLIGESDAASGSALEALYRQYNRNTPRIARMSIISAELAKISLNSYITMKISFTNQLRMIAERFPGANIHHILEAIGSDSRIGQKYLRSGLSYGGPCFPRDNRLVAYAARRAGLEAPLAEAADRINEQTKARLLEQVQSMVSKTDTVLVLGLAYKPDTYITEESAGLYLAQHLKRNGFRVMVHDYGATPANSPSLHEFEVLADPTSLAKRHDIKLAVLCCPWPQYGSLAFAPSTTVLAPWRV